MEDEDVMENETEEEVNEMTMAEVLSNTSGVVPKHGETAEAYVLRLAKVFGRSDFPEDKWEEMSQEAQDLANEIVSAGNPKKGETKQKFLDRAAEEMPVIEGLDDLLAAAPESNGVVEAPKKRGRPPGGGTPKEPTAPKVRKPSALAHAKEIILSDFSLTPAQILEKLTEDGFQSTPVTIATVKADFLSTLRVLRKNNLLSDTVVLPS